VEGESEMGSVSGIQVRGLWEEGCFMNGEKDMGDWGDFWFGGDILILKLGGVN
jgi:hypothetical protein